MYTWSPKVSVEPPAITLLTFLRQGLSLNKELIDSVWLACEVQGGTCLCPLTPPAATRLQAPATIGAGTSAPYACLAGTLYTTPKTTGKKEKKKTLVYTEATKGQITSIKRGGVLS